jgi:hypothetical protein
MTLSAYFFVDAQRLPANMAPAGKIPAMPYVEEL